MSNHDEFPFDDEAARHINRRGLLRTAVASVVAIAGGEWLGSLLQPGPAAEVVDAPEVAGLQVGEALATRSAGGGADVLVVRVDAQTLVAFDRRCPHLGCPVLWSGERSQFECPCHAASFDARTGNVLSGPPRCGLTPVAIGLAETQAPLARAISGTGEG